MMRFLSLETLTDFSRWPSHLYQRSFDSLAVDSARAKELRAKLPKPLHFYVDTLDLINRENQLEIADFPKDTQLLLHIEYFMFNLLERPLPAFAVNETDTYRLSQLKATITSTGRHFLYLCQRLNVIKTLANISSVSRNVRLLAQYFLTKNYTDPEFSTILMQDIEINAVKVINRYINELRLFAEQGEFTFASPYGYRKTSISFTLKSYKDFNIRLKAVHQKLEKAKEYFKTRFQGKDILLIRYQLRFKNEDERIDYARFGDFFLEFNKRAQKPSSGIKGYVDYMHFWKEDSDTTLVQDTILMFSANQLMDLKEKNVGDQSLYYSPRDLHQEVRSAIEHFLIEHGEGVFGVAASKVQMYSEEMLLLASEDELAIKHIMFESHESKRWKFFYDKLLPYFIYLSTLEVDYTDIMNSRFSRGQKPNPS